MLLPSFLVELGQFGFRVLMAILQAARPGPSSGRSLR